MRGKARRHGGSNGSAAGTTSMGDGFAMLQRSFRVVHRIKKPSEEELQHSASWRDRTAPYLDLPPTHAETCVSRHLTFSTSLLVIPYSRPNLGIRNGCAVRLLIVFSEAGGKDGYGGGRHSGNYRSRATTVSVRRHCAASAQPHRSTRIEQESVISNKRTIALCRHRSCPPFVTRSNRLSAALQCLPDAAYYRFGADGLFPGVYTESLGPRHAE